MVSKIAPIFLVLFPILVHCAQAATTLTGCSGGDFNADCSLAELHGGGSIQINDVVFENWNVDVVQGSSNLVRVTPIDDGSLEPGPGLLFSGPGVSANSNVGFEVNYEVSTTSNTPKFTGYELIMGFTQIMGSANGFAAMEITDSILDDTGGGDLEIANPEPTVDQNSSSFSDLFTDCNNGIGVTCPTVADPSLPNVISQGFNVTVNLDVSGGTSGSINSFTLSQRFSLYTNPPVKLTGCSGGDFGKDCSLAELNSGGTIQIDDIMFDNWDVDPVQGSLSDIRVTAVGAGSRNPGPGLLFAGPGVVSNDSVGFEAFYDVSTVDKSEKLTGYRLIIGFVQRTGTAGGFTAMQISDNILNDSTGADLLIANPEPTVDQLTTALSDLFTNCDNDITVTCPTTFKSNLPKVISAGFRVSINLDVIGGSNGSFDSFSLEQRYSLFKGLLCFPVKARNGKIALICL